MQHDERALPISTALSQGTDSTTDGFSSSGSVWEARREQLSVELSIEVVAAIHMQKTDVGRMNAVCGGLVE